MTFMYQKIRAAEFPDMNTQIKIAKGLDLSLIGAPEQSVSGGPDIQHVALLGQDYIGLKPGLLVSEGDSVSYGQPLFIDKRDPEVSYCSPGQGVITAVNRGPRRVLESVVVRLEASAEPDAQFEPLSEEQYHSMDRSQVARRLQQSGLWTAFRTHSRGERGGQDHIPERYPRQGG